MHHEVRVCEDVGSLARSSADFVCDEARRAVERQGRFSFAVSGGHTPWAMFEQLSLSSMPWEHTVIYQVDERVAPDGDDDRNLTHLMMSLAGVAVTIKPMPVNDPDLDAAAAAYAGLLPDNLDLVHLGLGPDGHCASLVPGDPVLEVSDRPVALTRPYQGRRRMTLTYPALAAAEQILWLISGEPARGALELLLRGDQSIPAGRVSAQRSLVMTDLVVV